MLNMTKFCPKGFSVDFFGSRNQLRFQTRH